MAFGAAMVHSPKTPKRTADLWLSVECSMRRREIEWMMGTERETRRRRMKPATKSTGLGTEQTFGCRERTYG